jgi:hypothetical protein
MKGLFVATFDQFIKPIIAELEDYGIKGTLVNTFDKIKTPLVDFIWVDFATEEVIKVQEYLTRAKKILRIHSFEMYTDIVRKLIPQAWDAIIFVSQRNKEIFESIHGTIKNTVYIPNFIDLQKYKVPEGKERTKNIAYAGYFNRKKGINEMYMLAGMFPDFQFHLAGTPQEQDLWEYMVGRKPDNVTLYDWQEDLVEFYKDKTYFLNTSVRESMGVAMVEAMCCGLKPLVHNWLGAENVYPVDCIWSDPDEFRHMLENSNAPEDYRNDIIERLSLKDVMHNIVNTICADQAIPEPNPTLTIGIVQTRKKYINVLLNSIALQNYPVKVDILDNFAKEKTIGACYNELADRCDTDFICYVGDDDVLGEDYIESVMNTYIRRRYMYRNIIGLMTGATLFNEEGKQQYTSSFPTGFWKTEYAKAVRFDESLVRQVDTDFLKRVGNDPNATIIKMSWLVGYYYRQHDKNISGNKFTTGADLSQTPVEE